MPELREHADRWYAVQFHYALADDAWAVELSEAVPAPADWADIPGAASHVPGLAFLVTYVPDEDPDAEPAVHVHSQDEHVIPFEIIQWFMQLSGDRVEQCRAGRGGQDT